MSVTDRYIHYIKTQTVNYKEKEIKYKTQIYENLKYKNKRSGNMQETKRKKITTAPKMVYHATHMLLM